MPIYFGLFNLNGTADSNKINSSRIERIKDISFLLWADRKIIEKHK